jgi:hypothetical protein
MNVPAVPLMRNLGLEPDPWQVEVLESTQPRMLLNCCRQAGKSTVVALLGMAQAIWNPVTKVLIVSRSLRQSTELFRIITDFYERLEEPLRKRLTKGELVLGNRSRIVCLPCKEETIRGFSGVSLLIMDEAARVPDDLYRAVTPMLAVSNGRLICLSTPRGRRGFFYEAWARGGADWQRIEVPATKIPRIKPEVLDRERRCMGEIAFRQEYMCSFEVVEGLVYPELHTCVVPGPAPTVFKRHMGGIDFGYRNPFAAVWGGVDGDGILWITNEHYCRQQTLGYHAARLPKKVVWYADPSGAAERAELRCANFAINPGNNAVRAGIAAVQARIRGGTLRIIDGACPNLLAEAGLYHYDPESNGEKPNPEDDHALDALRYLIARLDRDRMARPTAADSPLDHGPGISKPPKKDKPWLHGSNDALSQPLPPAEGIAYIDWVQILGPFPQNREDTGGAQR